MKRASRFTKACGTVAFLSVTLLGCGTEPSTSKEIPYVPRASRPAVTPCEYKGTTAETASNPTWLEEIGGARNLQDVNRVPLTA